MTKRLFVLMVSFLMFALAQAQKVEGKKCKTCGKPMKECRYKGRHPQEESSQQSTGNKPNKPVVKPKVRMDGNDLVFICNGTEYRYKMVYVSGGTYTMGCTWEQGGDCDTDERPAHSVTVSGFYMGQTEVTQALWKAVMGSEPTYKGGWTNEYGRGNNYPAYCVSYEDVKDFISKLNGLTGYTFRMPTEAEWEYAARGGSSRSGYKYSGGDAIDNVGWYTDNSGSKTHPVAQKRANVLGLYDMSGNVWEWCNDWYGSYSSNSQTDPRGPSSGSYRVLRGGSWSFDARCCRVSYRACSDPASRYNGHGFRLAR